MSGVECLAQELARLGASIAPAKHGAEVGESARSFQAGVTLECLDGLPKQELSTLAAGDEAGGTFRDAERARGAERAGELELLFCEASCRLGIAEREMGKRGFRSPGEIARTGDQRSRQKDADAQEIRETFGDARLFDPQPPAGETKERA